MKSDTLKCTVANTILFVAVLKLYCIAGVHRKMELDETVITVINAGNF